MSLEKAIKQEKFASVYQRTMVNILYTSSWLQSHHQRKFREFDVTMQQYNILRILRGQKGKALTLNCISDRMIDRMSNCSRLVEKLRVKGFVGRHASADDRRVVDVSITKKGLEFLLSLEPTIKSLEEKISTLSEKEANQLCDLLDKMRSE
jgi:DNA-binding MarR family transcriptional regulator